MSEVRPGDVIAGKFEIERVLGEGGMGYVVAARHLQLGQRVALKFIRPDVLAPESKKRFLREARNTVRLKSKHVSRVLDVGALDDGSPYMVMEYLEGTDLSEHLHAKGPLPPAEVCEYLIQACEAIAEAHGIGIVHRDLKPANLFLARGAGGQDIVKVLDFGVSKTVFSGGDADETTPGGRIESVVTQVSDLLGSPSYIAPEQIASARNATASSDVWSLGIILYRLLSGRLPFSAESLAELIHDILHRRVPNLREHCPNLPPGLEDVVTRCLERDPSRRPTATELARLLASYAGPSEAPSLERIAILGPALVVAADGRGSVRTTSSSRAATTRGRGDRGLPGKLADRFFWALLAGSFVASITIVAARAYAKRNASSPPPVPTNVAPPPSVSVSVAEPSPPPRPSAVAPIVATTTSVTSPKPATVKAGKRR